MPTRTGPWPGRPVIDINPPKTLRDLIDAGTGGVGTCLAEARYAPIHDARIDLCHRLIVDAKPMLHVGAVVLDHDVGLLRQLEKDVAAFRAS